MKLAKMMVEAGAAGIHIEDQARKSPLLLAYAPFV
jgi:isocitrate lyase